MKIEELVKEFFSIIDSVEESDNGNYFRPNQMEIRSCRVMACKRLDEIIHQLRTLSRAKPRLMDDELHMLNNPNDCRDCLGKGWTDYYSKLCNTCKGSGSMDPEVSIICPCCKGTGDLCNHERYSNDCHVCDCKGRVVECHLCDGGIDKSDHNYNNWKDCKICDGHGYLPDPNL